jgi:hypothetical protein
MAKTKAIAEFGDFQTPDGLADQTCRLLAKQGLRPASVIEPTCGVGGFLFAGLDLFPTIKRAIGADINAEYIQRAKERLQQRPDSLDVILVQADFFATDWPKVIEPLPEPVLILGNLPWVTNAHLGSLKSQNLPTKSNFQGHNGFDAITGKSNFDISEWMLMKLLEIMEGRRGALAMLCKSSVARKTLYYGWKKGMAIERSAIYGIEAKFHFDAAVDAVLLVTYFRPGARETEAKVFPHLNDHDTPTLIGYEDHQLLADITAYHQWKHLRGEEHLKWRSGIKHDCSKVMELRREGNLFRNGLGELADLEADYLYPMLKSSDVANGCKTEDIRWMIVTQKAVGQDTAYIEQNAQKTWAYLQSHADLLSKRGSSIYKKQAPFAIFGVGDYSFAPWKVAISGFYKKLNFRVVGPCHDKPTVMDDTSYFLPCQSEGAAEYLASILNSPTAKSFFGAFVFWDAKRPITADLLRRLDLKKLATDLGSTDRYHEFFGTAPKPSRKTKDTETLLLWSL